MPLIKDNYPVTNHHSLIIPKDIINYFDLYQPEINAISQLINETKIELLKKTNQLKDSILEIILVKLRGKLSFIVIYT